MSTEICWCCGEKFVAEAKSNSADVCPGCERLLEDEVPLLTAQLLQELLLPGSARGMCPRAVTAPWPVPTSFHWN